MNRYLDKAMNEEHEMFPRYKRYLAKINEIDQYRDYMNNLNNRMRDERRGVKGSGDYTEYEYKSAFEIPDRTSYEEYGPRLKSQDYARGRDYDYARNRDYDYSRSRDYNDYSSEEKWQKDIQHFSEKLKRKDRFKVKMDDVINAAKTMGINFNEFTEEEFYLAYLIHVDMYKSAGTDFRNYVQMAKEWLYDDDSEASPAEKLCIYYYEIIKGKGIE